MRKFQRSAVLQALHEWRHGYVYSKQLAPRATEISGRRVTEKMVGQFLFRLFESHRVERVYGENAYQWRLR